MSGTPAYTGLHRLANIFLPTMTALVAMDTQSRYWNYLVDNSVSSRQTQCNEYLVLKSMLVYIEVPTLPLPTMMDFTVVGTSPTSTYQSQTLPTISDNIMVPEDGIRVSSNTSLLIDSSCSTYKSIQTPMHTDSTHNNYHDQCQPINVAAICREFEESNEH